MRLGQAFNAKINASNSRWAIMCAFPVIGGENECESNDPYTPHLHQPVWHLSIKAPSSKKMLRYIDFVSLSMGMIVPHHLRSWKMWSGTGKCPLLGEPLSLSSSLVRNTWPALMTWDANCNLPIRDSSCLHDMDVFTPCFYSCSISKTLSRAMEIAMLMAIEQNVQKNHEEWRGTSLMFRFPYYNILQQPT